MKYEVTYCIHTKKVYQIICIDDISLRLTHLTITLQQPWMSKYLLWQWQIQ